MRLLEGGVLGRMMEFFKTSLRLFDFDESWFMEHCRWGISGGMGMIYHTSHYVALGAVV